MPKNLIQYHLYWEVSPAFAAEKIVSLMPDALCLVRPSKKITFVNQSLLSLLKYEASELIGQPLNIIYPASPKVSLPGEMPDFIEQIQARSTSDAETFFRTREGNDVPVLLSISEIKDKQGDLLGLIYIGKDIRQRKHLERRIIHLVTHDPLTGLPNRVLFSHRFEQAQARADRHQQKVAMMFLDLDKFKHINDTLGHEWGDVVLKTVADRLDKFFRKQDVIARFGGDEFIILLEDISCPDHAITTANNLVDCLNKPIRVADQSYHPNASIGLALYPDDGENISDLLKNADTAMYEAKKKGGNNCQLFLSLPE